MSSSVKFVDSKKEAQERFLKLQELVANFDSCEKSCEKSCENNKIDDLVNSIYCEMNYLFSYLMDEINHLHTRMYEHEKGHLPKIHGAEKLEEAMKTLNIENDYDIVKPTVVAASNHKIKVKLEHKKNA